MKRGVVFGVLAGVLLIAWGNLMWENREFVFENRNSLTPTHAEQETENMGGHATSTSGEKRENIFEYGGEDLEKDTEQRVQKPEVTYTASGFAPAVLHVKGGVSVTFFNKSGKVMRLASDYPDFPSLSAKEAGPKEIANGGSFSFVFKNKGYWSIGDADNASLVGVVSVE